MNARPKALLSLPSYLAGQMAKLGREPVKAALTPHGLVLPQYAILTSLDEFGPSSQQDLAHRLELDKSNVVKLLDGLGDSGLIERSPSPEDRRRHEVSITSDGHKIVQSVNDAVAQRQDELLATALTKPEREQLLALLRRVIDEHDAGRSC